jgi:pyridoxal phosphate enzyme (YggS family)
MSEATTPLERLEAVRARIARACMQSQRQTDAVRLLAVSKTFAAEDVLRLAALGQRAFGENYLQEALDKIARCETLAAHEGLEWHFIGPIQSNKTRPIAERFAWVHSVDRERVARRLAEQRPAAMPPLQVCLQINVSGEASKSGCSPDEARLLARVVADLPGLRLRGVMAIPAPTPDPAMQRAQFAALRAIFEGLRAEHPGLDTLSMGMSDDLEAAIAEGSTMVRVGTALFGARPARDPEPAAR